MRGKAQRVARPAQTRCKTHGWLDQSWPKFYSRKKRHSRRKL